MTTAPQIIVLVLVGMNIAINIVKHGEPRSLIHYHLGWAVLGETISLSLLWWGGFFEVLK